MSAIAMLRQLSPAYGVCSRKPLQSSSSLPMSRLTVTYTGLLMKGGRTLRRLLPRGTRFVDAVAQRLGAQVTPFEPDPESAARLRKHATRNRLDANLRVIEAALWSRSENSMTFRRGYPRSQGGVLDGEHHPVIGAWPYL